MESKVLLREVEYINLCDSVELTNLCQMCIVSLMSEEMRSIRQKIEINYNQCEYDNRNISDDNTIEDEYT